MDRYLPINIKEDLEENLIYQSIGFSIRPYVIEYDFERHDFMPLHWHKELQLSWVYEGEIRFLIDSDIVTVGENELLFINRNKFHSSSTIKGNAKTLCINFNLDFIHPKIIQDYINPVLENTSFSYLEIPVSRQFSIGLNRILDDIPTENDNLVKETNSTDYFQVIGLINLVVEYIVYNFKESQYFRSTADFNHMNKLLIYIQENYENKIMIKDLTDHAHISKTFCNYLFQKYTKMSPMKYITVYRLQIAQDLLLTTSDSVSLISEKCGFTTTSYFVEQFRLHYRLPPLKFRKKFQQKTK